MNSLPRTPKITSDGADPKVPETPHWNDFLTLPENRVAVRAARALCRSVRNGKRPAVNPLVLHGLPGTGKSRLVAALVHELTMAPEGITLRAVSAGDLARSADEHLTDRELFDCDVLALEDIQHLSERSSDAVCDLIDRRTARRRATVVTASAGPAALTHLPRRLTSRLAAGLVIPLNPLSAPSRRAILAQTATARGVRLDTDALDVLASQVTGGGVRATLGLLQNLAQIADACPGPLGRTEVEQVLTNAGQPTSSGCDVSVILKRVAAAFGVTEKELLGTSRLRGVLRPRQVAMYLVRELTGLSLPRIGVAFDRDHTTVLHACRKVAGELEDDATLAKQVSDLRATLG